ncbi:MAG: disulfide bond formation protein B [Pseudomonadota bacterium]
MTDATLPAALPSRRTFVLVAGAGSLGLLLAAWFFQYVLGYAPCAMCYWQRWPHMAAVAIAVLAAARLPALAGFAVCMAGGLAAAASAGIGIFHTGVERGWWEGPASCTGGGGLAGLSGADLLDPTAAAPVVMCDEIAWQLFGLTMANYNVAASLGLAVLWGVAAWQAGMRRAEA